MAEVLGPWPGPGPVAARHPLCPAAVRGCWGHRTPALLDSAPRLQALLPPTPPTRNPGSAQLQPLTQNPSLFLLRKAFSSFGKRLFFSLPPILVQGVQGTGRSRSAQLCLGPSWAAPQTGLCPPRPGGAHNRGRFASISCASRTHPEAGGQGHLPPSGAASCFPVVSGGLFWPILPLSPEALWGPSFTEGGSQAQLPPLNPLRLPAGYFRATKTHVPWVTGCQSCASKAVSLTVPLAFLGGFSARLWPSSSSFRPEGWAFPPLL